jgi:hypothetical protein
MSAFKNGTRDNTLSGAERTVARVLAEYSSVPREGGLPDTDLMRGRLFHGNLRRPCF